MIHEKLELFADYFQFYLRDEQSEGIDGDTWTEAALHARLALEPDAFAVSTVRNMDVLVDILVVDATPSLDLALWDHVVEFSIGLPSGRVIVAGCTDYVPDAKRLVLDSGTYQVRVLCGNMDSLSKDGLDGDDHYRVELWKGETRPLRVLKQFVL